MKSVLGSKEEVGGDTRCERWLWGVDVWERVGVGGSSGL